VVVTTDFKRLFLRGLKWDAEDASESPTLADTLKTAARAQLTTAGTGTILTGTSGNGHAVTFSLPMGGRGMTPQDMAELCEDMLTRYDAAEAAVIAAGTASRPMTKSLPR
jgi:L-asparagine transporter-like permease